VGGDTGMAIAFVDGGEGFDADGASGAMDRFTHR
jgi:hypothetical protein